MSTTLGRDRNNEFGGRRAYRVFLEDAEFIQIGTLAKLKEEKHWTATSKDGESLPFPNKKMAEEWLERKYNNAI